MSFNGTPLINYDPFDSYERYMDSLYKREFLGDWDEEISGNVCPVCGYPLVIESGLEVCYYCGWSREDEIQEK